MEHKSSSIILASQKEFIENNYILTAFLYKEISSISENIIVSPLSIQVSGALFYSCAKHDTATEIRSCLKFPAEMKELEVSIKVMFPCIKDVKDFKLHASKKVFIQRNANISKDMLKTIKNLYQTEFENVDFSNSSTVAQTINAWIQDHANNIDMYLMKASQFGAESKMVAIDVLTFTCFWKKNFTRALSTPADFHKATKEVIKVRTMRVTDMFNYYKSVDVNAQLLEIPFVKDDTVMTIVLPTEAGGIATLEEKLENILAIQDYTNERVEVSLPSFRIQSDIDVKKHLQKLGIKKLFTKEADISGLASVKGGIYLNELLQKSYLEVNEDGIGVEATSVTHLLATTSRFSPKYQIFKADHPFLFYIKEKEVILFIGKVTNPLH